MIAYLAYDDPTHTHSGVRFTLTANSRETLIGNLCTSPPAVCKHRLAELERHGAAVKVASAPLG